jgi:excisionase family DNA binding protein
MNQSDNSRISQSSSVVSQIPRNSREEDQLLTVREAAHFLNLAPGTLYHLISEKRIPVVRISSRCVRFQRKALVAWIESHSQAESARS